MLRLHTATHCERVSWCHDITTASLLANCRHGSAEPSKVGHDHVKPLHMLVHQRETDFAICQSLYANSQPRPLHFTLAFVCLEAMYGHRLSVAQKSTLGILFVRAPAVPDSGSGAALILKQRLQPRPAEQKASKNNADKSQEPA